jgi:type IV pilus assembly protein PilN
MIKINLLPIRAARKREYVKQQLILFAVLLAGTLVGLYLWWNAMDGKVIDKKKQISQAEQQIEQYKKAIGEVEKYKGLEEMLNRKLKIIDDLIRGKTGPVRVLDRLSQVIPKQVWLTKWEEKGGTVTVEGEALSNKHVGNFMSALGAPPEAAKKTGEPVVPDAGTPPEAKDKKKPQAAPQSFFTGIRLVKTKAEEEKQYQLVFVSFTITMRVNYAI